MTDIERFFTALSERAHRENDLSDLTYAMCEADLAFKQFFLDFFFGKDHIDASRAKIEREHSETWGRPDFHIQAGGKRYIVEVKIFDGNHHFEQYFNILAEKEAGLEDMETGQDHWNRLGYIANYDSIKNIVVFTDKSGRAVTAGELCHVATWKEFVMELERYKSFNDPVISAYTKYVRKVCPFDDFQIKDDWKISIEDFLNIKQFDVAIEEAITNPESGCREYGLLFGSQSHMGRSFEWKYKGQSVCGWLGAYYTNEGAVVCVTFANKSGWGDLVCNDSKYISHVKDNVLHISSVDSKTLVDRGASAMRDFLKDVLQKVEDGSVFDDGSGLVDDRDRVKSYSNTLLAMKSLPFALERYLLDGEIIAKVKESDYEITLVYRNDQEVPRSHCGRYFELRKIISDNSPETSSMTFLGWIGVLYNSECMRDDGNDYGVRPSLEISIRKGTICPDGWQGNNWGWRCYDILTQNDGEKLWREMFAKIRKQICNLVEVISRKHINDHLPRQS